MGRTTIGAALGFGLGLLLVSILVVLTTAWWLALLVPLLIPIALALAGGALGRRMARTRPPVRHFWTLLLVAMAFWPLGALLPIGARWAQFRWMITRDIPTRHDFVLVERRITTYAFDDNPGYSLEYACTASPEQAVDFFQQELPKHGWKPLASVQVSSHRYHQFSRDGQSLSLVALPDCGGTGASCRVSLWCCVPNLIYKCPPIAE